MTNRISGIVAALAALMLAACDTGSTLPEATGKASIRAINAMPTSPEMRFLIEERALGVVAYKGVSTVASYDDLEYTFHIEIPFAGESSVRRVASQFIDVQAGKDYTLLVSGAVSAPTITIWELDGRTFDEGATVFEAYFTHAAASAGTVDFYFAAPGIAPVLGEQAATLDFGEISTGADFSEGDYVLTITPAGEPETILYQSASTTLVGGNQLFITPFDGGATETAPVVASVIAASGGTATLPDVRFSPTVEFINASLDLGVSDIYDDEALTSQIVANHAYGNVSNELSISAGSNVYYYTPAGDVGAVTLEAPQTAFGNFRYRIIAVGSAAALASLNVIPDRTGVDTHAKLSSLHASNNFTFLDVYAVAAGESIDDAVPSQSLAQLVATESAALTEGSYDLYVTEFQQKEVLAGPYRVDVAIGDVIDLIILDTVDPAVLDVLFLSGGPSG